MDNNDLIRRGDALCCAIEGTIGANRDEEGLIMAAGGELITTTREWIAKHIEEIPAIEKEEPKPEKILYDWEPVKASLENILQRTTVLVGLNPTRTDESWLWANTMAGALLEVIRRLEAKEWTEG